MKLDEVTIEKLKSNPGRCIEIIPTDDKGVEDPGHVGEIEEGGKTILEESDHYTHECPCKPTLIYFDLENRNKVWKHQRRM